MKLTPIGVRGKRRQPKAPKDGKRPNNKIANEDTPNGDTTKLAAAPQAKRAKLQHRDVVEPNRRRKALPRLSQLPQEILERIFIASRNLALSLVNCELYHRLSSDSVRYQLVGAAFGPTWDAWYGLENAEVQSYQGWMADADRIAGDPTFQSAVLACSWAKLPLLLASFNVWIRQHANGRPYFVLPALDAMDDAETQTAWRRGGGGGDDEEDGMLLGMLTSMEAKFEYDMGFFSPDYLLSESLSTHDFADRAHRCRALLGQHLEVNPGTMIADDLLAGPFFSDVDDVESHRKDGDGAGLVHIDAEKYERLFWLVRGGACLQVEQTWEVTREGFRAILDLIREVSKRKRPELVAHDARYASPSRVLMLAAGLFILFDILGVFSTQWPKYILQTSLAEVLQLIPTLPTQDSSESTRSAELLLGNIAASFRSSLRNYGTAPIYECSGYRWRRPHMRVVLPSPPTNGMDDPMADRVAYLRTHYCVGHERALYLDTFLQLCGSRSRTRTQQSQSQSREETSDHDDDDDGDDDDDDDDDNDTQVMGTVSDNGFLEGEPHRNRYEAYMKTVGGDPRLLMMNLRRQTNQLFHEGGEGAAAGGITTPTNIMGHEPWSDFSMD